MPTTQPNATTDSTFSRTIFSLLLFRRPATPMRPCISIMICLHSAHATGEVSGGFRTHAAIPERTPPRFSTGFVPKKRKIERAEGKQRKEGKGERKVGRGRGVPWSS